MHVTSPKQSTITSRLRMLHSKWTPQDRRRRAVEGRRKAVSLIRLIKAPQEPEIWATGSLMEIDLQRLEREFVSKPSCSGDPSELSQRGAARLSNGA